MPEIELRQVTKSFGAVVPMRDFSCLIPQGSFTLLSGPSGAGKTTLLRLIAGLEQPDGGTISIGGQLVSAPRVYIPPHCRRLGMSFQEFALWPHKTVHGHLDFVLRTARHPHARRKATIAHLLDLFELGDKTRAYPVTLSGGQQQRLNLARALAASPPLLLLDEPFAHLDSPLRTRILTELLRLKNEEGLTIIAAAHAQEDLEQQATNIIRLL